jgi:hypothetical protein
MKYFYSALILISGLAALVGFATLIGWISAELHNFEGALGDKYIWYRKFKDVMGEKILPWAFAVIIIVVFFALLVLSYFEILKDF